MVNNVYDAIKCTEVQIKQLPLKESSKDPANLRHDMAYLNVVMEALDLLRKKEQGRLVVLPCKVGDKVYEPRPDRGIISIYEIKEIGIGKDGVEFLYWTLIDGIYANLNGVEAYNIGKTVFLTPETAEAALSKA